MAFSQELFVQQIDRALAARGISMRQAAAECGVHPAVLSRVRNGQVPDIRTISAVLDWLDIPAERVFPQNARPTHGTDFVIVGADGSEMHVEVKSSRKPPTREVERLRRLVAVAFEETVGGLPATRARS